MAVSLASTQASAQESDWLAFSSGRTGDGDIYVADLSTGLIELAFGTDAPEGTVRFDPNGVRIVFHRFADDGATLMSGSHELFVDPNGDVAPSWSARGEIAYA